ncbi:MAG: glutamyl-tRNA reductase [Candidatus Omnitrophica bacterium]|nr:glutamyl-tRNA reductase [Candidatus Omnitrophota bacterium]
MTLVVLGINHKTAPLDIRERYSFPDNALEGYYRGLLAGGPIREAMILSTCNRVEIYGVGEDAVQVVDRLVEFLNDIQLIAPEFLRQYFYRKTGEAALGHFFRVASGLDSMLIGEPQILGQIKRAYEKALAAGAVGSGLHAVIQDGLRIGKKVRNHTGITRGVTSLSGVVIDLIKREPGLNQKKILVIGAGKIGATTVGKLAEMAVQEIVLTNRDIARAAQLARQPNWRVAEFVDLPREVAAADIVVAATTAPHLINRSMLEYICQGRQKELLLIDLGVPRNIDAAARAMSGVRLYNIDDLAPVIEQTIRDRAVEARKAQAIVSREILAARRQTSNPARGAAGIAAAPAGEKFLCELSFSG